VKKILVVEDEPAICDICRRVLGNEDLEVDCAPDGRVAQDMIEEKQYDLYLFDIRTPKMNGEELYRWMEKKYPQLTKKVILTTGSIIDRDALAFVEQSGRPFLPKPFTTEELKTKVAQVLKTTEG
jgi:DNA-binding response OmpR family regulator